MISVQIYGLPRTGTNYLEFLVRNNLKCSYSNRYDDNNRSYVKNKVTPISLKHCKPKKSDADKYIIIMKESGNFIKSFLKWDKNSNKANAINLFKRAVEDYYKFYLENKDNCVIIFHEDLITDEEFYLNKISEILDIKLLKKKIKTTDKRMDKSGGRGFLKVDYKFTNEKEVDINETYLKIKDLKLKK